MKKETRNDYDEELFESLKKLREEIASSKEISLFIVFSNSVLKEFSYYYPTRKELFLAIKGVGKNKLDIYGEIFMKLIKDYIESSGISREIIKKREDELFEMIPPEKPKVNVKERTEARKLRVKELILEKKSIEEIANDLELTPQTIVNYIDKILKNGDKIDVQYIKDSVEGYSDIVKSFEKHGTEKMGPIYGDFAGNVDYSDIALVRVLMQA